MKTRKEILEQRLLELERIQIAEPEVLLALPSEIQAIKRELAKLA